MSLLPPPYWVAWLQPDAPPILIKHPKHVNKDLQGPIIHPEGWPEPIWGRTVRLYRGNQERWDPAKRARVVLKPGHRDDVVEPNGEHGTGWVAYLEFIGMCWKAGATPEQTCRLLEAKPETGPGAQHYWQGVRHRDLPTLFLERWNSQALRCPIRYYSKQVDLQTARPFSNETHRAGLITESHRPARKPFQINERTLDDLRCFLLRNPGLNQTEVKDQAPLASQQVTSYLVELEARGQGGYTTGKSTGGRPPKYWFGLLTPEEIAADEEANRQAQVHDDLLDRMLDEGAA